MQLKTTDHVKESANSTHMKKKLLIIVFVLGCLGLDSQLQANAINQQPEEEMTDITLPVFGAVFIAILIAAASGKKKPAIKKRKKPASTKKSKKQREQLLKELLR